MKKKVAKRRKKDEKGHIKLGPVADGLTIVASSSLDDSKKPFFRLVLERHPWTEGWDHDLE